MIDWIQFGQQVRGARRRIGLSQEQFAQRSGLSVRTLRDIERGQARAPRRSVGRITEALGLVPPEPSPAPAGPAVVVGVLGPLVLRVDATEHPLESGMQRTVLGLLAIHPGQLVGRDELVDVLWGDRPPTSCLNLVQTYVARLRRLLGSLGLLTIDTVPGGYRLRLPAEPEPAPLDVLAFNRMVADARRALGTDDRVAAELFGTALDLWRGPVLADLDGRVRTHPATTALHRDRLTVALEYATLALAQPLPEVAVTRVLTVTRDEPLHEALHARLMLLLAASGQQADALALFDRVQTSLADDLGVDAGPALREAHIRVLRQDLPAAEHVPATQTRSTRWLGRRGHVSHLVGRDGDATHLSGLLRAHRLVTMTGPAGCGKTALALYVAERHRGDVVVLAMAGLSTSEEPTLSLAGLLGAGYGISDGALAVAIDRLSASAQLLVLDNAEHLAPAVALLVAQLLGACPKLTVLVTSRQPLGVSEEVTWQLDALPVPVANEPTAAIELFCQRARQALGSVDLSDADAIAWLVRRLDGLPLALELVAAQVRALSVPHLVDRLDLALDMQAAPGTPERHRTLRSAIDWSYQLLTPNEQQVLTELSVLRGSFDVEAAEAVSAEAAAVLPTVLALVDRSLLVAESSGSINRFRLLETVREYAAARLAESGAGSSVRRRHLRYWLARAGGLAAEPDFASRVVNARALAPDLPDAESALATARELGRWADQIELAILLHDCWNVNPGYLARGAHWLSALDEHADCCPRVLRASGRLHYGQILGALARPGAATTVLRAALPDASELDTDTRADLLSMLVTVERNQLDPAARSHNARLLTLTTELSSPDIRAAALDTVLTTVLEWYTPAAARTVTELLARCGGLVHTCPWLAAAFHGHRAAFAVRCGASQQDCAALAELARVELAITSPARRYILRHTTATVLLALNDESRVVSYLRTEIDRLTDNPTGGRLLAIPYAEALRRAGRPAMARHALAGGIAAAVDGGNSRAALPGVLVAAALATTAGDPAATALATAWQTTRCHRDLPVPLGYDDAIGLIGPALTPSPAANGLRVEDAIGQALTWCRD